MKIHAGYDIAYDLPQPTSIVLMLTVHPSRAHDLLTPDDIRFSPSVESRDYLDSFGNICTRIVVPAGRLEIKTDFLIKDSGKPDVIARRAAEVDIDKLPNDALQFLLPSRYCDNEALSDLAWSLFGAVEARLGSGPGYRRLRSRPYHLRLSPRAGGPHCLRGPRRKDRRVPRLCTSRGDALPMHEHSGALLHGLPRRHRRAEGSSADGFQRLV